MPIASPCVNVCQMSPRLGVCTGCCRTLDEIACWSEFDEAERAHIVSALPQRRRRLGLAEPAPRSAGARP